MTDNILTLLSARQTDRRPDAPALAGQDEQERWYDISWCEFDRQINVAAKALASLGVKPGACVGTFSANRPENLVTDFACYRNRAISVSIYATSSPTFIVYVVNGAYIANLIAGNSTQCLFAQVAQHLPI